MCVFPLITLTGMASLVCNLLVERLCRFSSHPQARDSFFFSPVIQERTCEERSCCARKLDRQKRMSWTGEEGALVSGGLLAACRKACSLTLEGKLG